MEENTNSTKRSKIVSKIVLIAMALLVIALIFFLFRNVILEILKYTKANDEEGLKEFMRSTGWIGYIAVVIIEALEMVVVFIPAEFIQIPAGLSFNFFLAILLCDLGVCLGASIIYFLVHHLKVNNEFIEKSQRKIKTLATKRKGQSTQILMYFLFVTPIIPFGAICYFASSKKISYRRYILTCATGVIPSIVTSIIMGTSLKYFLAENLSVWGLVGIIVGLGALLFIGMFFLARKFLFGGKKLKGTPHSVWSVIAGFLFGFYVNANSKWKVVADSNYNKLCNLSGPKLYLANHLSPNDTYHIYRVVDPSRPALVGNKYFMRFKFVRFFMSRLGFVTKMLYNPDIEAVKKMIKYRNDETSIMMFPEARLSLDGTTNPLTNGTAALVKKLKMNVVLIEISGNYFACSKVRKSKRRVPVSIRIKKIIEPSELETIEVNALEQIIKENLSHDDSEYALTVNYRNKNKAENLDKVLYYCPHCHKEFEMKASGNSLECSCGFKLELDNHYQFSENDYGIKTIHDYYELIKDHEREEIKNSGDEIISQEVLVKKISFVDKKLDLYGTGVTKITKEGFSFSGEVSGNKVSFSYSLDYLQALPFSINEEYECYYNNELYYFYPKDNRASCTKVALIYDLLQEEKHEN